MPIEAPKTKGRRFMQGVAVLVTSLAGYAGAVEIASAAVTPGANASASQSPSDFVIAPAQAAGAERYQHESHSSNDSHSSHDSHGSHDSHASHTSSAY